MTKIYNNIIAIIPAAGIGKRMLSNIPKQYIIFGKKTIIEYTINVFLLHPQIKHIIVVLHKNDKIFNKLKISKNKNIMTVIGGNTRSKSVFIGVQKAMKINYNGWVIVHDAARPFIRISDINKLLAIININNIGGILAVPITDTVKYSINKSIINGSIERKNLWLALTPQLFPVYLLFNCLKYIISNNFFITDESSALEYCGYYPKIIVGRRDNIKITRPEDLNFAKCYLELN